MRVGCIDSNPKQVWARSNSPPKPPEHGYGATWAEFKAAAAADDEPLTKMMGSVLDGMTTDRTATGTMEEEREFVFIVSEM